MSTIILIAIVFFGVAFVVLSMMMVHEVSQRGVKINVLMLRLYVIKYMHQYRVLTKEESGRTGPLFYPCIASINAALLLALAYALLV